MMRLKNLTIILAVLSLAACSDNSMQGELYPWQVTAVAQGNSRVFGLELGRATFADAQHILGRRYDAAIFENQDGRLSLEVFYKEITLGGLTAKFVLSLDADTAVLQRLKGRPLKKETLESGVIKYIAAKNDTHEFMDMNIVAITYMPITNLTDEIVSNRFGEPAEKIRTHDSAQHWLYPDKGLDVLINAEGDDVLQFVPPREFARLRQPLSPRD
ncbi:MAG: hypothetical protein R6X06_10315 [Gammaproteobacteria bacterium]